MCLIVALATKNIVKKTKVNERINGDQKIRREFLGPEKTIYLSTTKVTVPPSQELKADPDHPAKTGTSPKPHIRMGHIHTFLTGKGRLERKKQWVAPMFVNADASFVAQAKKYRVDR